jgi:hypothetical protein
MSVIRREHQLEYRLISSYSIYTIVLLNIERTSESPLSLVKLAGSPAGNASLNMSSWPSLAALYMRVANSMASGGITDGVAPSADADAAPSLAMPI